MGRKEPRAGAIAKGIAAFKAAPHTYAALWYQADMVEWPADQQKYTLLHRNPDLDPDPDPDPGPDPDPDPDPDH